jgi:hypothetical protein
LKAKPVITLGKKKVDFGGITESVLAMSLTCSTGTGRWMKATSD